MARMSSPDDDSESDEGTRKPSGSVLKSEVGLTRPGLIGRGIAGVGPSCGGPGPRLIRPQLGKSGSERVNPDSSETRIALTVRSWAVSRTVRDFFRGQTKQCPHPVPLAPSRTAHNISYVYFSGVAIGGKTAWIPFGIPRLDGPARRLHPMGVP